MKVKLWRIKFAEAVTVSSKAARSLITEERKGKTSCAADYNRDGNQQGPPDTILSRFYKYPDSI